MAIILAASILFFFLILFAGGVAILREGSPGGHAGLTTLLAKGRRIVAHHLNPHHSNPHHNK